MSTKIRNLIQIVSILFVCAITSSQAADANTPARVVLIGDSTVCDYPVQNPERGWGQYLKGYFDDGVVVINLAKSGRSTKTFIKEGLWKMALEKKPDFVLIQFGHNDSHPPAKPEATNAATDYKENLRRYIDEARAIGARPVLITPMVRRIFKPDGTLANELQPYADAMKQVGEEKKVPVIDLHASSKALVEPLGAAGSADMANKPGDNTHFGEKGAKTMAELVMKELPSAAPELKSHLKKK
jgi:lysophospholipase L1-like esterase